MRFYWSCSSLMPFGSWYSFPQKQGTWECLRFFFFYIHKAERRRRQCPKMMKEFQQTRLSRVRLFFFLFLKHNIDQRRYPNDTNFLQFEQFTCRTHLCQNKSRHSRVRLFFFIFIKHDIDQRRYPHDKNCFSIWTGVCSRYQLVPKTNKAR